MNLTRRWMLRGTVAMMLLPITRVWSASRGAEVDIKRIGSQASTKGPAEWFTGTVRIDPVVRRARAQPRSRRERDIRAGGAHRMAHAPARSDADRYRWCRTSTALGWANRGNSARRRRLALAGRKALARAAPTTAMTHIAIQEKLDGKPVDWLEHVTPEQYEGRSGGS